MPGAGIHENEVLPLRTFGERLSLKKYALEQMRHRGLPVKRVGGRLFVVGSEAAAWFRGLPPAGESAAAV